MQLADDLIEKGVLKTPRIIDAFRTIKRRDFMPNDLRPLAGIDEAFPIGNDQTISQPYTVTLMLELLDPRPGEIIMDVGYGSGWQTALLAHCVGKEGKVHAIERIKNLCIFGKKNLENYSSHWGKQTVHLHCRDAKDGLPLEAKRYGGFDKIIAAAAAPSVPHNWEKQLAVGGKIVMPIDHSLWVFTKKKDGSFKKEEYPGFAFVPLVTEKTIRTLPTGNIFLNTIAALLMAVLVLFVYGISPPSAPYPQEITIPGGSTARQVSRILTEKHIVRFENVFLLHLFFRGDLSRIQAGVYLFEKPRSSLSVSRVLVSPPFRRILTVRVPESSTLRGIALSLEEAGLFSREEFWRTAGRPPEDNMLADTYTSLSHVSDLVKQFSFLNTKPLQATLEGYLFPDTYDFFDDATPPEITFKMLQNFETRLREEGLFEEIEAQGRTLHEVLTFASLLEKEAITYEDKRIIAGIINNRLQANIPLQLDASLMYVTGRGSSLLTKDDLALKSPYNTYVIKGLPAGPIANPGIASIKAALHPEETPYFYYLSDNNLTIHYSRTFEEHKQKKALYIP